MRTAGDAANARATFETADRQRPHAGRPSASVLFDVAQTFARNDALVAEATHAYQDGRSVAIRRPNEGRRRWRVPRRCSTGWGNTPRLSQRPRSSLARYDRSPQALLGRLWLGKAQLALGDLTGGMEDAAGAGRSKRPTPTKARALRNWRPIRTSPPLSAPFPSLDGRMDVTGQAEAEAWLRGWLGLEASANVRDLRAGRAQRFAIYPRQRAVAFGLQAGGARGV
ncbi:MAG: hypothetical protein KatS3mg052_1538 [Candidatus Roseilinea sp.]|nr:MAG: hypothetical protein KatS3mg052_1538 [Candidatus Roseilinea sp.]